MISIRRFPSAAALCLGLAISAPAAADSITVTSGNVLVGYGRGSFRAITFDLQGDQLSISGSQPDGPAQTFLPACNEFSPCDAGDTTSPSGTLRVTGIGSATIDGTTYPLTQYFGANDLFTFTAGTAVIPGASSDTLSVQTPFTFGGTLDVFALDSSSQWSFIRSLSLTGAGTATVNLRLLSEGYAIQSIRYDFANPTPEPASLVLLGTGAAIMIRRRVWRRGGKPA